jgi:hypothetical protein
MEEHTDISCSNTADLLNLLVGDIGGSKRSAETRLRGCHSSVPLLLRESVDRGGNLGVELGDIGGGHYFVVIKNKEGISI